LTCILNLLLCFSGKSLIVPCIKQQPEKCEHRHAQEYATNSSNFAAGKNSKNYKQRMQLNPFVHQVRRKNVVLKKPVKNQENSYPPKMWIVVEFANCQDDGSGYKRSYQGNEFQRECHQSQKNCIGHTQQA